MKQGFCDFSGQDKHDGRQFAIARTFFLRLLSWYIRTGTLQNEAVESRFSGQRSRVDSPVGLEVPFSSGFFYPNRYIDLATVLIYTSVRSIQVISHIMVNGCLLLCSISSSYLTSEISVIFVEPTHNCCVVQLYMFDSQHSHSSEKLKNFIKKFVKNTDKISPSTNPGVQLAQLSCSNNQRKLNTSLSLTWATEFCRLNQCIFQLPNQKTKYMFVRTTYNEIMIPTVDFTSELMCKVLLQIA